MHYDLNGNMRSFERYNGDEILKYKYLLDGNQLVRVKRYPGTKDSEGKVAFGIEEADNPFEYDAMGNLVYDGQNQLKISYDFLNLPEKIAPAELHSQAGELFLANYCYLWNGEKVASTDIRGSGYMYTGSVRYELTAAKPAFDSAPFAMGRIQAGENGNAAQYFLNDHLGSVRSIVNHDGIVQLNTTTCHMACSIKTVLWQHLMQTRSDTTEKSSSPGSASTYTTRRPDCRV